ncbi:protein ABHD15-like [Tubulanus polymorphus]|uniref:protein ABHD15-like n=1 Tax=Tubulanus polymorphus TaxID=672921 RepID=UPI003DA3477C
MFTIGRTNFKSITTCLMQQVFTNVYRQRSPDGKWNIFRLRSGDHVKNEDFYDRYDPVSRSTTPTLFYRNSTLSRFVIKTCPRLERPFSPPCWLRNGHVQTILTYLLAGRPLAHSSAQFNRQFLQMKDGGIVSIDWYIGSRSLQESSSVVIVIPGLFADSLSVSKYCKTANKRGYRPLVFHRRGTTGCPFTTPFIKPAGDPTDFRQLTTFVQYLYPDAKLFAISYGLGSNILLSYLGEYGSSSRMTATVAISAAFDSQQLYSIGISRPYKWLIEIKLKLWLLRLVPALGKHISKKRSAWLKTNLYNAEHKLMKDMHKYSSVEEYWENNNPLRDADDISTPLLCINSSDDPISSEKNIAYDLFSVYPNLILALTDTGGHCGFMDKLAGASWADELSLDYFSAMSKFSKIENKRKANTCIVRNNYYYHQK